MILSSFYNDTRLYITVCNKSSLQDIRLVIEQRLASNRWRAMTPYPKFPPHRDQHVFVKEERNVRPNDKFIRITLVLEDNPGVMLESPESSSRVTKRRKEYRLYVKPGTTVHVVDDPANPPLSKEQVEGIARHYQTIVESRVDDVNNVFGEACSSVLQRNHPSFGRVDELRKLFKRSAFLRSLVEAHWLECYQPVPIPTQSNMNLVKKICDGRFLVHAYWRRFQASGQYVVRYSMDLSPNPQDSSVWIYWSGFAHVMYCWTTYSKRTTAIFLDVSGGKGPTI